MRRISLFLALVLSLGLLAACSSSSDSANSDTANSDTSAHMSGGDTSDHGMGSSDHGMDESKPAIPGARQITLTANALSFDPETITLKAGEGVNVALTSVDLEHDLYVKRVGHIAHAKKGATTVAGLEIDKAGTYPFWCTVKGHKAGGMKGTITVTT